MSYGRLTFRRFGYDELVARDKVNLDITWLRDDSLEDPDSLPAPEVLIAEIQEEMAAIFKQFGELAVGLGVEPLEAADVEQRNGCVPGSWRRPMPCRRAAELQGHG